MRPNALSDRRPYLFVALLMLLIVAVYVIAGGAGQRLGLAGTTFYLVANVALALAAAIILTAKRWWREAGFRSLRRRRDLALFWLPALPIVVNLFFGIAPLRPGAILVFLILSLLVGFSEEAFFRGLMLQALAPRGRWRAAIITAVLFGIAHSLNLLAGANGLYTVLQIGWALAMGFCFAALVLRTGVVWPLVITHALTDFAGFVASGGVGQAGVVSVEIILAAIYIVVFTAYGIWLMRGPAPAAPVALGRLPDLDADCRR